MSLQRVVRWGSTAVVVGVVAALIILSGQSKTKTKQGNQKEALPGEREICAGRLKALGQALRVYAADYDGRFPVLQTPDHADKRLPPLLDAKGVNAAKLRCPARPAVPYPYHCYRKLSEKNWPKWVAPQHIVTMDDPKDTWLAADELLRGTNGPHSPTTKAFNFLKVDGSVQFSASQPRKVYK